MLATFWVDRKDNDVFPYIAIVDIFLNKNVFLYDYLRLVFRLSKDWNSL